LPSGKMGPGPLGVVQSFYERQFIQFVQEGIKNL
jgi:hypothetical protein